MRKLLVLLCVFLIGCNTAIPTGPYPDILVNQELIPGSCSAWTDGCDVFCRTGNRDSTSFSKEEIKDCKDKDLHRPQCIDEDPEKLEICINMENYVKNVEENQNNTNEDNDR